MEAVTIILLALNAAFAGALLAHHKWAIGAGNGVVAILLAASLLFR